MKKATKIILGVFIAAVIAAGIIGSYVGYRQRTYYPMGGKVTVVDKQASGEDRYLVIREETGEQLTLLCPAEFYDSVRVGDTVGCERTQSIFTHKGMIHKIVPIP